MLLPPVESVVADGAQFTAPLSDSAFENAMSEALSPLPMTVERSTPSETVTRVGEFGTWKVARRSSYMWHSFSGQACAAWRDAGLDTVVLNALDSVPGLKVTGLDAAFDVLCDVPEYLCLLDESIRDHRGVRVGRTWWPFEKVAWIRRWLPDGRVTGTYEMPLRFFRPSVRAKVYDKGYQLFEVHRDSSVKAGDRLRAELSLHGPRLAPRDVVCPELVYWHFMRDRFLPMPNGIGSWCPAPVVDRPEEVSMSLSSSVQARRVMAEAIALARRASSRTECIELMLELAEVFNDAVAESGQVGLSVFVPDNPSYPPRFRVVEELDEGEQPQGPAEYGVGTFRPGGSK